MTEDIDYEELRKIHDKDDMYGVIKSIPDMVKTAFKSGKELKIQGKPENIVIMGLGGSALPGVMLQSLADLSVPVIVHRELTIPASLTKRSLAFVVSYSGDTSETLTMYRLASKVNDKLIAISSGGKLKEICRMNEATHIMVPPGLQPRMAYPHLFFPILNILTTLGLVRDYQDELEELIKNLSKKEHEEAGRIFAAKLYGRTPLILSSSRLAGAAYKWKIDMNENAKTLAFWNVFPELCHNEINGLRNTNVDLYVIILRDDEELPFMRKAMDTVKAIFKEEGVPVAEIMVRGKSRLQKLFVAIMMGDWVSYHLALRYETDPTSVPVIDLYKQKMGPTA